ncbi:MULTISPECIES: hypothetical protein [unclassified Novosphingobium]|uniref:hypothetical protein n=1 Tax=unclassified Novosphingobium TaxID=2644732 RepID=UPI000EECE5BC|nr:MULTISPECIES: hypothetical protein [unclassified Novosphingobium]HCF25168.1 hypothetical protein [Novosphingobium sp.]HQV02421.1 hypothetical protein [Novosphingobium sp.]
MFLFPMIAAAGAATQPLPPATEADMRCFMAMLYSVGGVDEKEKDKRYGLLAASSYFVGRLDGQVAEADWTGHIRRIGSQTGFFKGIDAEVASCALRAGKAMQFAGTAAQNAAEAEQGRGRQ